MGIKGFNTWFGKTFPQAYVPVKRQVDHLYLDMASFLHEELRKAKDQDNFHHLLHARLDAVLRLCEPRKTVTFALDGPAPLAKLITQRERRRKEQIRQERMGLKVLSSLGLTPGTSLMALIQQSLAFYICRSLDSERWQHIQWELSGANVQGEGETKILSRVLRPWADVAPGDEHAIVALDSDVVLMALMMPNPNVYVLAEPARPPRVKGKPVRRVKALRPMFRGYTCFSPAALHQHWYRQHPFLRAATPEETGANMASLKRDLVVLAILSAGNDYLPSLGGGSQKSSFGLWTKYLKLKASASWASRGLTKMEGRVAVLNRPALADLLRTMPGRAPPFANDVEGNKPAANAKLYIEGMEWILRMYSEGSCPDYRWTYDSFAPQASQVLAELSPKKAPAQEDEAASASEAPGDLVLPPPRLVTREGGALLPTVCAMALLPAGPAGQAYAPTALRHLMTNADSPVADLYQSCSACEALRQAESRVSLDLMEAREHMYVAEKAKNAAAVSKARAHASELEAAVASSDAEAADGAFKKAKQGVSDKLVALRIATQVRNEHTRNAHPYRAFPIDRLEAAVKAIPLEEFPVVERELAGFGSPHRFWSPQEGPANSSRGVPSNFTLPDAPASAMGIIPDHARVARENLAEELPWLHLPPLAVKPGVYKEAAQEPTSQEAPAQASAAAVQARESPAKATTAGSSQAQPDSSAARAEADRPAMPRVTMQQLLRRRARGKIGPTSRHPSIKKRLRQMTKRPHAGAPVRPSLDPAQGTGNAALASGASQDSSLETVSAGNGSSSTLAAEQRPDYSQAPSSSVPSESNLSSSNGLIRPNGARQNGSAEAGSAYTGNGSTAQDSASASAQASMTSSPDASAARGGRNGSGRSNAAAQAQPLAALAHPRHAAAALGPLERRAWGPHCCAAPGTRPPRSWHMCRTTRLAVLPSQIRCRQMGGAKMQLNLAQRACHF